VIVLGILGYRQSGGRPYHTTYRLREDGNPDRILTDNLEIHFLDLVRFREEAEKDVAGNAEHRWLSYLDVETPGETVEELVAMDIGIAKAQERMEEIARGGGLQRAYELYEMSLSDETSMLNGAREEGEAIGLTKGREETVKNLLAYGMSMEQISRALKLPPDTVRQYLN
jgi:predicted transposase/invertase (TIGR01784 family)